MVKMVVSVIFVVLILMSYEFKISASVDSLQCDHHVDCICSGSTVVFECTIVGAIATVWKGSFFDCPSNSIALRHREFTPGINGTCNDGAVVANAIDHEAINNSYTSKLTVTVDPDINNGTVECIRDSSTAIIVGTCLLSLASEFYLPPDGIEVSDISSEQFTLHWSPPTRCPFVTYNVITAVDCGVCPNTTTDTFIMCTNLSINGQSCTIVIQARACENDPKQSNEINFNILLKAPDTPDVNIVQYQAINNSHSTILKVTIKEMIRFNITPGIDGSATSYTITYTDSISGSICDVTTIVASSCDSRVCTGWFDLSSSLCQNSSKITVTAFATNVLGDGLPSQVFLYKTKEVKGSPMCEKCDSELNFIIAISFSSAAIVLLIVIIIATVNIVIKRMMQRRHDQSKKEDKAIDTIIYEDIEVHQPSLSFCDTTDNVAYSHTASCK